MHDSHQPGSTGKSSCTYVRIPSAAPIRNSFTAISMPYCSIVDARRNAADRQSKRGLLVEGLAEGRPTNSPQLSSSQPAAEIHIANELRPFKSQVPEEHDGAPGRSW